MNLQKLNLQEMQTEELMEISGGTEQPSLWESYWGVMTDPNSHAWILALSPLVILDL
ncbi:hypothetical protein H7U19_02945 [Hyunsoonleella sp. SJ7]|uniref:Uncharacterized protein n=1 Tax=Hyunsoonleella aquatilis TaxID=2762758 RepID=A0A923HAE8_9FLAO|nr:hypothetical protein [Hyunsoonleella aquatilis]MBC3757346.1 hypothetical protein [Hyunsoonleella aquatilis]